MKNIKNFEIIIKLIIEHTFKSEKAFGVIAQDKKTEIQKLVFLNKHTLQLSTRGLEILSTIFTPYKISLPENYKFRCQDLITLDRECLLPYYINRFNHAEVQKTKKEKFIILFEQELALLLKLNGGDLDSIQGIARDGFL
ncbi:MAG: hypothetical protein HC836_33190 [Richelia sp. RM2_1_2]|nr:hypothetical protein [Richelia sp. RM2_1_2]